MKKASSAVNDLTFSKKRIAQDVKKALNSAIANAENNHNLDVDRLVDTGLVTQQRQATTLICRANYPGMDALIGYLADECCADGTCPPASVRSLTETAA